jgi:site-specific DNA-methyltransferase (adenine-specific)
VTLRHLADGYQTELWTPDEGPEVWTSDEWETPWATVHALEDQFNRGIPFDLDPCAWPRSAKASRYFTPREDGLGQAWDGMVFMNPPYSVVDRWVRKAVQESLRGVRTVALLPVRTDRDWWHDDLMPYSEITFLRGRLRFIGPDGTTVGRPVWASAVALIQH